MTSEANAESTPPTAAPGYGAGTSHPRRDSDVVRLVSELIRIDTTNPGDNSGPGEIEAARWVAAQLAEVGITAELFTTTASHRAGVAALLQGTDANLPPLLLTGHLDVVPAVDSGWTHPPFSGHIDDEGVIWGRGAVDMKNMVGMILAVVREWQLTNFTPRRSIALLFTPDEEAGGHHGAHWIVKNRPDLLQGATDAIGEVGGFSMDLPNGARIYPVQTGEKGLAWITATVPGTAGHGSLLQSDSPVAKLVTALNTLATHPYDVELTPAMQQLVDTVSALVGEPLALDDQARLAEQVGSFARVLGACVRTTINPTMLNAGVKHNVVPNQASAGLDVRFLPGTQEAVLDHITEVMPAGTTFEFANLDIALETDFDGDVIAAIVAALAAVDPTAKVVPYLMTGGTDGKAFSTLGVRYFGFSPLLLSPGAEFWSMFHGVDERVPSSGLVFGTGVLDDVLRRL